MEIKTCFDVVFFLYKNMMMCNFLHFPYFITIKFYRFTSNGNHGNSLCMGIPMRFLSLHACTDYRLGH